jgi:hypothetical protein
MINMAEQILISTLDTLNTLGKIDTSKLQTDQCGINISHSIIVIWDRAEVVSARHSI